MNIILYPIISIIFLIEILIQNYFLIPINPLILIFILFLINNYNKRFIFFLLTLISINSLLKYDLLFIDLIYLFPVMLFIQKFKNKFQKKYVLTLISITLTILLQPIIYKFIFIIKT